MKYSKLVKEFVDNLKIELIGKFHDNETKFLVATHLSGERTIEKAIKLFKQANERSVERPKREIVDGLWAYEKVSRKFFTVGIRSIELNLKDCIEL